MKPDTTSAAPARSAKAGAEMSSMKAYNRQTRKAEHFCGMFVSSENYTLPRRAFESDIIAGGGPASKRLMRL